MKVTFVDSGVLIAAARGEGGLAARALAVLDDPERQFATSNLVKLEVLPKAIYQKNLAEVKFYELFFKSVSLWAEITEEMVQQAYQEACRTGLAAIDALHNIAAAVAVNELNWLPQKDRRNQSTGSKLSE